MFRFFEIFNDLPLNIKERFRFRVLVKTINYIITEVLSFKKKKNPTKQDELESAGLDGTLNGFEIGPPNPAHPDCG